MSLKMKLTSTIMAFMLLASMLIVGVFAVKQTEFSVGGNIVFNASGINATISKGTLAGGSWVTESDADEKMKAVTINTEKSASQLAEEYESWSGLNLEFNEAGDDVTITFTITNNSTNVDDSLIVYINIDDGTSKNAAAYVENTGAVIAPNTNESIETENVETFVIRFNIIDKEVNASLTGFKIDFDIRYATATADSATDTTLTYEGVTYTKEENNALTLSSYSGESDKVVIPAYLKNNNTIYTVTSLGEFSFGLSNITNVSLPNTVTSLKEQAFYSCGIVNMNLPKSITSFGNYVFNYCENLERINLPDGLTTITNSAFADTKLTSIILPSGLINIEEDAFSSSLLTHLRIPSSVKNIEPGAFKCQYLTSISVEESNTVYDSRENCNAIIETASNTLVSGCMNTIIPNTVTSLGEVSFMLCKSLKSITLPDGITSIGDNAFRGCENLHTINLPDSLTNIGKYVFLYTSLNTINYNGTEEQWNNIEGLANANIPSTVTINYNCAC